MVDGQHDVSNGIHILRDRALALKDHGKKSYEYAQHRCFSNTFLLGRCRRLETSRLWAPAGCGCSSDRHCSILRAAPKLLRFYLRVEWEDNSPATVFANMLLVEALDHNWDAAIYYQGLHGKAIMEVLKVVCFFKSHDVEHP